MAEQCEKIVEIRKISKNKDLTSAVTVISKGNEKNTEEIKNLKEIIEKLMTTTLNPKPLLETKTISALGRTRIQGDWPDRNEEIKRVVRFRSESPEIRSRSQTPDYRRQYRPTSNQIQNSNWGNQSAYEIKRCYICDKKGHLANECWRRPAQTQNTRQNRQMDNRQSYHRPPFNIQSSKQQRNRNNGFRRVIGQNTFR